MPKPIVSENRKLAYKIADTLFEVGDGTVIEDLYQRRVNGWFGKKWSHYAIVDLIEDTLDRAGIVHDPNPKRPA